MTNFFKERYRHARLHHLIDEKSCLLHQHLHWTRFGHETGITNLYTKEGLLTPSRFTRMRFVTTSTESYFSAIVVQCWRIWLGHLRRARSHCGRLMSLTVWNAPAHAISPFSSMTMETASWIWNVTFTKTRFSAICFHEKDCCPGQPKAMNTVRWTIRIPHTWHEYRLMIAFELNCCHSFALFPTCLHEDRDFQERFC
jgi:hypothetical protein